MTDRTCPTCNIIYDFPCTLKKHMLRSFHCKTDEDTINLFFKTHCKKKYKKNNINFTNPTNTTNTNTTNPTNTDPTNSIDPTNTTNTIQISKSKKTEKKEYKCPMCNACFSRNSSLIRHIAETNCKNDNNNTNSNGNSTSISNIIQNANQISNSTNELQVNINNNNNNNSITNNITHITHIYPFGYEDVSFLTKNEMKNILKHGELAGLEILKVVYSKIENKNFFKPNMNKNSIASINNKYYYTICNDTEFANKLFNKSIKLLYQILFLCKDELDFEHIKDYCNNIEYIKTIELLHKTIYNEVYENKLKNIIEEELQNNNTENRNRITKYSTQINKNPDIHKQAQELIKHIIDLEHKINADMEPTIDEKKIFELFGNPNDLYVLLPENMRYDFMLNRFEDTQFFLCWKEQMETEIDFITNGLMSLGNILYILDRHREINMNIDKKQYEYDNRITQ